MSRLKIFIAHDHVGAPISVLLAETLEKANIAWMGMKDQPHSVEMIDPDDEIGMHGVVILLTSTKCRGGFGRDVAYRTWKRGL